MANPTSFPGDGDFQGELRCTDLKITNSTNKIEAKYSDDCLSVVLYADSLATIAAAETGLVGWVAFGAGTIKGVKCGSIVAAVGDSTVTIDVKKDGTTVLDSTVVLDSSNVAYTPEDATLDGTAVAFTAGDVFTVVITVSAGTGTLPYGVYVALSLYQDYPH